MKHIFELSKTFPQFYEAACKWSDEKGGEDEVEALLGAFPVVRFRDGVVLVVGVGNSFGEGGISITVGLKWESVGESGLEVDEEVIFVHLLISVGRDGCDRMGSGKNHFERGECIIISYKCRTKFCVLPISYERFLNNFCINFF